MAESIVPLRKKIKDSLTRQGTYRPLNDSPSTDPHDRTTDLRDHNSPPSATQAQPAVPIQRSESHTCAKQCMDKEEERGKAKGLKPSQGLSPSLPTTGQLIHRHAALTLQA